MQYTQDTLFPDSEIVGTGRPVGPWVVRLADEPDTVTQPVQADELPFDEEPQP